MATKRELLLRRHLELSDGGVVAEIFVRGSEPYRTVANGRRRMVVGRPVMVKAGMDAVEWEGDAEQHMCKLCEVATPVHTMAMQPHLLRMKVVGQSGRMDFIPDMQLTVDTRFAAQVAAGDPFVHAVRDWKPVAKETVSTLIVEIKDDKDRRNFDDDYQDKLRLARQVYRGIGWFFVTVMLSRDIVSSSIDKTIHELFLGRKTKVAPEDITALRAAFANNDNQPFSLVQQFLGGGGLGFEKICALHTRRLIQVDVAQGMRLGGRVRRVRDGRPIFETPGKYPW